MKRSLEMITDGPVIVVSHIIWPDSRKVTCNPPINLAHCDTLRLTHTDGRVWVVSLAEEDPTKGKADETHD